MSFMLEKMERAAAVSGGGEYLDACIAAIKALDASIEGDDFKEHAKNITHALGLMPRQFIEPYFPVDRSHDKLIFVFSNGKKMETFTEQIFSSFNLFRNNLNYCIGAIVMISDFESDQDNVLAWRTFVSTATRAAACKSYLHFLAQPRSRDSSSPADYENYVTGYRLAASQDNPLYATHFAMLMRQYAVSCKKKPPRIRGVEEYTANIAAWCPKIATDILWTMPDGPGRAHYDSWMTVRKELLENGFTCACCNAIAPQTRRCTCKRTVYCSRKCQKVHWKRCHKTDHYEVDFFD